MRQPRTDFKVAIFSGGAGTRLWPVSRRARPKQFQPLTGPEDDRDDVQVKLIEQPGREILLHGARAARDGNILIAGGRPGLG